MAELTRDQVLLKAKRGDKLERADLRGVDLSKVNLPGAALSRCDLEGANLESANLKKAALKNASLREAYLAGADLQEANLENADLEGAKLDRANLAGANLSRANLEGASLAGANLSGARLPYAQLGSANLTGADLRGAVLSHALLEEASLGGAKLEKADLTSANLEKANLTDVDARRATLTGARLAGATLTGAKVAGLVGTGAPTPDVQAAWLDTSEAGDGTGRISNGEIPSRLSGLAAAAKSGGPSRRYFGHGDVLRNATLTFEPGAHIEIDSLFENCSIQIGEGTELVVGSSGVLADCNIAGGGSITINGQFFERESPGIVGPRELVVSREGALVASIQQSDALTRFRFERGSRLRVKIAKNKDGNNAARAQKGG
jgi:uncharacterized protein YjbI with pentapeptide repeats